MPACHWVARATTAPRGVAHRRPCDALHEKQARQCTPFGIKHLRKAYRADPSLSTRLSKAAQENWPGKATPRPYQGRPSATATAVTGRRGQAARFEQKTGRPRKALVIQSLAGAIQGCSGLFHKIVQRRTGQVPGGDAERTRGRRMNARPAVRPAGAGQKVPVQAPATRRTPAPPARPPSASAIDQAPARPAGPGPRCASGAAPSRGCPPPPPCA